MTQNHLEIEAKFPLREADVVSKRIAALDLPCLQPCSRERNLRLDTPDGRLRKERQVLRLRETAGSFVLTYKGSGQNRNGVAIREEIETEVENLAALRLIFERLGFVPFFIYEKERSIYQCEDTLLMLDHTPIGNYLEIEGADEKSIRRSAEKLGLDWDSRTDKSYQKLFHEWAERTAYEGRDMVFSEEKTVL